MGKHETTAKLSFLAVWMAALAAASCAAYYGTIVVFARDRPLIPQPLIAVVPDALAPAALFSTVAALVMFAASIAAWVAFRASSAFPTHTHASASIGIGCAFALALLSFGYVPGALVDSIPGFTTMAWVIFVGFGGVVAAGILWWAKSSPASVKEQR